jgi:hypothetical protein
MIKNNNFLDSLSKDLIEAARKIINGEASSAPEQIDEKAGYSAKEAAAGKDIGKKGKNFDKIADKAAKKYGSKEAGERVAGAILNKLRHEETETTDETIEEGRGKKGRLKQFLKRDKPSDEWGSSEGKKKATAKGGKSSFKKYAWEEETEATDDTIEEGRGKKGAARQAAKRQPDEWDEDERYHTRKHFRIRRGVSQNKKAVWDESVEGSNVSCDENGEGFIVSVDEDVVNVMFGENIVAVSFDDIEEQL